MLQRINNVMLEVYPTIVEEDIKYIRAGVIKAIKMSDYPHMAGCRVCLIKADGTRAEVVSMSYATVLELRTYFMVPPKNSND